MKQTKKAKQAVRAKRGVTKRIVMHPTATFALLAVGVFLSLLTYRVAASDYTVTGSVLAAPLTSGAVITKPIEGQKFTTTPTTVNGTCPNDSYVKLSRNGSFSGVAICQNGQFAVQTDLFDGLNDLQAQDYTITDQPGTVTVVVHVSYDSSASSLPGSDDAKVATQFYPAAAASSSAPEAKTPDSIGNAVAPLLLTTDYHFTVTTTAEAFQWNMQFHSNAAPYGVAIDWGDKQKTTVSVPSNEPFRISHRFDAAGYYLITAKGTDRYHRTAMMQLAAFIKKPGDPATSGNILPTSSDDSTHGSPAASLHPSFLSFAWPAYAIAVVMVASFWLGERREYLHFNKRVVRHR